MKNEIILALDQALKITGWSLYKDSKLIDVGNFSISANLPIERRLTLLWHKLNELYAEYEFNTLAFEDIQLQGNAETYKKLAYVQASIILWCYNQNIEFHILSPSHWRSVIKKHCGISFGRSRKEQKKTAQDFVNNKFNMQLSEDEADSVCIGYAYFLEKDNNKGAF
jgi:Holliday junction resolvasome RuvABC endonuclease subunit